MSKSFSGLFLTLSHGHDEWFGLCSWHFPLSLSVILSLFLSLTAHIHTSSSNPWVMNRCVARPCFFCIAFRNTEFLLNGANDNTAIGGLDFRSSLWDIWGRDARGPLSERRALTSECRWTSWQPERSHPRRAQNGKMVQCSIRWVTAVANPNSK